MSSYIEGDILFVHDSLEGFGDIQLSSSGRDLEADKGLETATVISLFSNRREPDETRLPDESGDRGGWWGNEFSDFQMGSRLWLLRRAKRVNETLSLAEQYCTESLRWMVQVNLATRIDVTASFSGENTIQLDIQIVRPDVSGDGEYTYRYYFNWKNQIAKRG